MITLDMMAPLMFAALVVVFLIGFPVAFSLAALGLMFGMFSIHLGFFPAQYMANLPSQDLRDPVERPVAGDPVLHLHGRDPRALRPRRGSARRHGTALRPASRRARLRRHPRRRGSRRDHRHGRRLGDRDGRDLAPDHDALRLRHEARHRRDRGLGDDHPAHPAVARAGRARRSARQVRRRHVQGRDRSLARADPALPALHHRYHRSSARARCRRCRRRRAQ